MADPTSLSVNFGNLDQLVTELGSIIGASKSTMDEFIARINSTIMQDANWDGPGGKEHWHLTQQKWSQSMDRMHQLLDAARNVTVESSQSWPAIEQAITNLFV
jgi:uncharacterized protein YukE